MWDEKTTYRIAGYSWGGPNIGPCFGSEADEITNNLWKQTQVKSSWSNFLLITFE